LSNPVELDPRDYPATLDILKKIDFFQGVPDAELNSLLFSLQVQIFTADKKILFQGEIGNRLFVVRKGSVRISTKSKGEKVELAELTPPAYFGEISLLRPVSATATATAGADGTEVLILTFDNFERLAKKAPEIKQRIQSVIEARLESKKKAKDAEDA
jgi:CRP/FNR family transcriptional regulator